MPKPKRQFGRLKGLGKIGPEFFEPLPEEALGLWNGEEGSIEPTPSPSSPNAKRSTARRSKRRPLGKSTG